MTVTLNQILPDYAQSIGMYVGTFATSTDIAANNNIVSTALSDEPGFEDDDALEDMFVRILGAENDQVIRRVTDYDASGDTLVVSGTALAAESGSVDFEVYLASPRELIRALNMGREFAYPSLHRVIQDTSLSGGFSQQKWTLPTSISDVHSVSIRRKIDAATYSNNLLADSDPGFESAAHGLTSAKEGSVGTTTISLETETTAPDNYLVFKGSQSARIEMTEDADHFIDKTIPSSPSYEGVTISFSAWVYARNNDDGDQVVKLGIDFATLTGLTDITLGEAHQLNGWQKLTVSAKSDSINTNSLRVGLFISKVGVVFTDEWIAVAGPSGVPEPVPSRLTHWKQYNRELAIYQAVSPNEQIVLTGTGLLSELSDGADTMEIVEADLYALYMAASAAMAQGDILAAEGDDLNESQRKETHWRNRLEERSMALPSMQRVNTDA